MSLSTFLSLTVLSLTGGALAYTETQAQFLFYKNIDPIKFPGSYTKSHQHIFFGSDAITATTTTSAELRTGCVTETNTNDFSTYWTPTLLYTGGASPSPIIPNRFNAYYEYAGDAEIPFPENLKMIVGNAEATSESQMIPGARASWYCDGPTVANGPHIDGFPAVTCPSYLHHLLYFQDCVNPTTLEVAYSSTSYGNANRCPTGMKRIVRLRFSIRYILNGIVPPWNGKAPLDISSSNKTGTGWSSHGDFINGWDPLAAKNLMMMPAGPAQTGKFVYVAGSISDGSHNANTCKPKDREPTLGTSDYQTAYNLIHGSGGAAAPPAPPASSSAAAAPVASSSKAAAAPPASSSKAAAVPPASSSKAAVAPVSSSYMGAAPPAASSSVAVAPVMGSSKAAAPPAATSSAVAVVKAPGSSVAPVASACSVEVTVVSAAPVATSSAAVVAPVATSSAVAPVVPPVTSSSVAMAAPSSKLSKSVKAPASTMATMASMAGMSSMAAAAPTGYSYSG